MLQELKFCMSEGDILKAKAVLKLFKIEDPRWMRRTVFEISRANEVMAVNLILFLLHSYPNLKVEVPTISDVLMTKIQDAPGAIAAAFKEFSAEEQELLTKTLLKDTPKPDQQNWIQSLKQAELIPQRDAFVQIAIKQREVDASPLLVNFWHDPSEAIQDQVQHFFASCRYAETLTVLMQHLSESSAEVPPRSFWERAVNNLPLEEQKQLIANSFSTLRTLAKYALRQAGENAIPYLKSNLEHSADTDVHIHTLNVMGETGLASAVEPIRAFLFKEPESANARFAAYEALGCLPVDKKSYALIMGFSDPDLHVRIAAARAIDRALNEQLLKGVRRMITAHDADALGLCECILEGEASKLFQNLKDEPFFRRYAMSYLPNKAHPDLKSFYKKIAVELDDKELLEALTPKPAPTEEPAAKKTAFVVDDSRMILVVYRGLLHKLGVEPVLFEDPREAIARLASEKPDIVFTDLNMPHLTGIELTKAIRLIYPMDQLPVVMVTTQTEDQDDNDAQKAGITSIMRKPFTQQDLQQALEACG
jgi:CheY-like chemotaxis protein/HEAT repeat protein